MPATNIKGTTLFMADSLLSASAKNPSANRRIRGLPVLAGLVIAALVILPKINEKGSYREESWKRLSACHHRQEGAAISAAAHQAE
jgi:hypothetical protein